MEILLKDTVDKLNIKDITKKNYLQRILTLHNKLYHETPKSDLNFLNNTENIINFINSEYTSAETQKSFLVAIKSIITYLEFDNSIIEKYNIIISQKRKEIDNKNMNNVKDDKYHEIDKKLWEKILIELKQKITSEYGKLYISKNEITNQRKYNNYVRLLEEYKLLMYYFYQAPTRLEIYNCFLTKSDVNLNYIKDGYYHVNNYKNIKSMGKQKIKLHEKINDMVNNLLIINHGECLFNQYVNHKIVSFNTSKTFGKYITRTLKKYFNVEMSINTLRKSYESNLIQSLEYQKLTNFEKIKKHNELLHGINIANKIYNKV
jgi:hypothetical protein